MQTLERTPGEQRMQKGYPVRGSPRIYLELGPGSQRPQSPGAAGRLWALRDRAQIGPEGPGPGEPLLRGARYGRDGCATDATLHAMISPTVLPSCSRVCTCHSVVVMRSRHHGLLPARTYRPACLPVITKYSTSWLVTQDPLGTKRLLCPHRKSGNPVSTTGGYPGKYVASLPCVQPDAGTVWPPPCGQVAIC